MRSLERIVALLPYVRPFVRPSVCLSVGLSVCPSGTSVHCDHTVPFSADLSLLLDSPMLWSGHPDNYKACPPPPSCLFPVSPGREVRYRCTGRNQNQATVLWGRYAFIETVLRVKWTEHVSVAGYI